MKRNTLRFLLCVLVGLGIALAAKIITDYDHAVDFSRYKTYSWLKVEAGNPLWIDRIRGAVESQLAAKGWTQVPSGGDAAVAAFGSTQKQAQLRTFYDDFGGGWGWRGFGGVATSTIDYTPIGTLVVDIFDAATRKLIWRGVANDVLSDKPEKNVKKLQKAVEKMFERFPPQPKG